MHVHIHLRELIFLRKSDCLGCAVLLCLVCLFVCLTLLASFFLPSHLSLKHIKLYVRTCHAEGPVSILHVIIKYQMLNWYGCVCTYMLMRDEKERREKQARSNKQQGKATQHTQGSRFAHDS